MAIPPAYEPNIFLISPIEDKLNVLESSVHHAMLGNSISMPVSPARGRAIVAPLHQHPSKKGFSRPEGRARLLHDLANIELQAMELGLRTLYEYPEAPTALRDELAEVTLSEGRHLKMCLEAIEDLGFHWGDWPIHLGLWETVSTEDSLIDRMFIVHRYLEGSGLDAQDTMLRRLEGVHDPKTYAVLKQIHREEVDHVYFGSRWQSELSQSLGRDKASNLRAQLARLRDRLPRRIQPICHKWRLQAGFSPEEIEVLEDFRQNWF
ncbi:MAG: hypothetical protein RJB66_125 [Pseudomonadota bacterium]|jgi:uncharacterized ferritin-like protein (DUF455 family)